jgi:mRNA-degrading endonuclease RelE of RelBE toxin-antitoxin system
MRRFAIEENLKKTLKKIFKKDKLSYNIIMNKIDEVLNCADVDHYKNLRKPLQHLKRVHIKSSFVLTFKYLKSDDKVIFYDFDHHDNIYNSEKR